MKNDDYAEYSDEVFLKKVGVEHAVKPLSDFGPKRGPQWDALATLPDGSVTWDQSVVSRTTVRDR